MAHLSINGFMAGETFCGHARNLVMERGEEVVHPVSKLLSNPIYRQTICPQCLAVWDNADEPTIPMPGLSPQGSAVGNR